MQHPAPNSGRRLKRGTAALTMRIFRNLGGLVCASLLAGCIVTAEHPLPPSSDSPQGQALVGSWVPEGRAAEGSLHVFATAGPELEALLLMGDGEATEWLALLLRPTRIGGATYVSARIRAYASGGADPESEAPLVDGPWIPARYQPTPDGRLRIALLDDDAVSRRIANGLEGRTSRFGPVRHPVLTASSKAFAAAIATDGDAVFAAPETYIPMAGKARAAGRDRRGANPRPNPSNGSRRARRLRARGNGERKEPRHD